MGVLVRAELERRIKAGQLISPARLLPDGSLDLEADSYDLSAGKVVWKTSSRRGGDGTVQSTMYVEGAVLERQPTVTVQPGQMVFAVTREDVIMPDHLCGTVYSRNSLAGEGILALNAGHIDPGYRGQVMIRLINMRASPWTLTLGQAIFTIVFQSLDARDGDHLVTHAAVSREKMDHRVKKAADESMSNALLDLYSAEIDEQLRQHYSSVEQRLRAALSQDFVARDDLLRLTLGAGWKYIIGALAGMLVIVGVGIKLADILPSIW